MEQKQAETQIKVVSDNRTHQGQYKPYGDSYDEWDIQVAPKEDGSYPTEKEVLAYCQKTHGKKQSYRQWVLEKDQDSNIYWGGYYKLQELDKGTWHYTMVDMSTF